MAKIAKIGKFDVSPERKFAFFWVFLIKKGAYLPFFYVIYYSFIYYIVRIF